jgi:hypothetical protein
MHTVHIFGELNNDGPVRGRHSEQNKSENGSFQSQTISAMYVYGNMAFALLSAPAVQSGPAWRTPQFYTPRPTRR